MAKRQDFEYVPLTKKQKCFCKQFLIRSNMLLKKWEGFYPENNRHVFRRQIVGGENNPSGKIPAEKLVELQTDLLTIRAPRKVRHDELGQRTVEEAVLSGFVGLCRRHARMWSRENDPTGITFNDYLHEAYAIVLAAMYAFTREDVDLSTFFWRVLHNRMINVTNQLPRLKNDDLKLVVTYEKTRNSVNKPVVFEEIVKLMGLDDEAANHLGTLLTRIYAENQISINGNNEYSDDDNMDGGGDYTAYRAGINHEDESLPVDAKLTVNTAIENADLNSFEKIVIRAFLADDSLGWQTRLSKSLVNPNTGKHYSRMWITMAKEKAMEKLRKYLTSADAA